jgi:antitoxin component YwqK of YwqJK toxin-antitoxin module
MRKIIKPIIIIAILGIIAYFVFTIYLTPNERFKAINVIPDKSAVVIEVDDPLNTWKKINASAVWKNFTANKMFNEVNEQIVAADSLISNNNLLFKVFGSRYVMFSIHQRAESKYEPLIVADLERYSKLSSVKKYILSLANESVNITKRSYNEFDIYEIFYKKKHSTLYLTFHKNLAILTYDQHLLEESLDCILNPVLGRNDKFVQIHNHIFGDGLMRLYLNYDQIQKIINSPGMKTSKEVSDFISSIYFSGFKMEAFDDQLNVEGYTNIKLDDISYLNALSRSGSGGFNAQKIIPKSLRFAVRLGFDSFDNFMLQFEELLKEDNVYDDYLSNYNKIEKKLDIDIQENFIDWIDDEISIFSIEPRYKNLEEELFLAIKSKNRRTAVKNLEFIKKQIEKKTPAKFTAIDYKGYEINYLQITGLIKLLFGNAFLKMDKPYYTVIEEFVVFSNHPQALKDLINDYKKDETLKQWNTFQNFYKRNFGSKSNIFAFANIPFSINSYSKSASVKMKNDLNNNKEFFQKIPFVALNMVSKDELFQTRFVVFYDDSLYHKELIGIKEGVISQQEIEPIEISIEKDFSLENSKEIAQSSPFKVEDIAILDLAAKDHYEYFADSTIRIEVEVNNGIKDGRFVEYYENGEIKLKGKFENDVQTGTWKFYDLEGSLLEKKKF